MPNLGSQAAGAGLRVLLTNSIFRTYSGSELYVRDVALALRQRGHRPAIYSPRLGALAEDMRQAGLPVMDDLSSAEGAPDLIHGQHHLECMAALARYPGVPAIYFCHGVAPWVERPPRHPRVLHYVVVSEYGQRRLRDEHGIPAERLSVIRNFVNLERFQPRSTLPPQPRRALVFSNQAREDNYAGLVRAACARQDIALDIIGLANGNPCGQPETLLGHYDLVFARGRCALESLAVGAAVICCDIEGMGPMVTSANLALLRSRNLGRSLLTRPTTVAALTEQILRYDPIDARRVSDTARGSAGLQAAVDSILDKYVRVLEAWGATRVLDPHEEAEALAAYLRWVSLTAADPSAGRPQAVMDQLREARAARRALQEEAAILQQTLTWRLYRRLMVLGSLGAAYRALARPVRAWARRRRAE